MSDEISVESTGETVGEAKWAAVRDLARIAPGLDRETVRFQVVDEGERGLLGVGTTPARVVATAPVPLAVQRTSDDVLPDSDTEVAQQLLDRTLTALGLAGTVDVEESDGELVVTVSGTDTGVLIGRHGQMLDALQLLANAVAHARGGPERRRIVVDAGGYRDRRTASLETMARKTAEHVAATGRSTMLDPMSAAERRIIHESLKDDPEVETLSEGAEPYRCVVVTPRARGTAI